MAKTEPRLITYNGALYDLHELLNKVLKNFTRYALEYGYSKTKMEKDYRGLLELLNELENDPNATITLNGLKFGSNFGYEKGAFGKIRDKSKHYRHPTWMILDTLRQMTPYSNPDDVPIAISREGILKAVLSRLVSNWATLPTEMKRQALQEAITQAQQSYKFGLVPEDRYTLEDGYTLQLYLDIFTNALNALGTETLDDDLFRIYGTFGLTSPTIETQLSGVQNEYVTGIQREIGCSREEAIQIFNTDVLPKLREKYTNDFLKSHGLSTNTPTSTSSTGTTTSTLPTTSSTSSSAKATTTLTPAPSRLTPGTTPPPAGDSTKKDATKLDGTKDNETPPPPLEDTRDPWIFDSVEDALASAKPGELFIVDGVRYKKLKNGRPYLLRTQDYSDSRLVRRAKPKTKTKTPVKAKNGAKLNNIRNIRKFQEGGTDELRRAGEYLENAGNTAIGIGATVSMSKRARPISKALIAPGFLARLIGTGLNGIATELDLGEWVRNLGPMTADAISAYIFGKRGYHLLAKKTLSDAEKALAEKLTALINAKLLSDANTELQTLQREKDEIVRYLQDTNVLSKKRSAEAALRHGNASSEQLSFLADFEAKRTRNTELTTQIRAKRQQLEGQLLVEVARAELEVQTALEKVDLIKALADPDSGVSKLSKKYPYNFTAPGKGGLAQSAIAQGLGYGWGSYLSDNGDLELMYMIKGATGMAPSIGGSISFKLPEATPLIPLAISLALSLLAEATNPVQVPISPEFEGYDYSNSGLLPLNSVFKDENGVEHIVKGFGTDADGNMSMVDENGRYYSPGLYGITVYGDKSKVGLNRKRLVEQLEDALAEGMMAPINYANPLGWWRAMDIGTDVLGTLGEKITNDKLEQLYGLRLLR